MGKRQSAFCADSEWTAMFFSFLSIRPIIDSFLVFFGAVICWRSVLTFRLRKRERYSLVLDILFFCCFIQLTCHVTKTSSISGLHAQKIGKPQIEFLTSSLLDRSAKCISCFSKEATIHSTKWLLPLTTKQIAYLCMQTIYIMCFGGILWVVK